MRLTAVHRIIRFPFDASKPDILPGQSFRASDFTADDPIQESIKRGIAAGHVLIEGRAASDIDLPTSGGISLGAYGVEKAEISRESVIA